MHDNKTTPHDTMQLQCVLQPVYVTAFVCSHCCSGHEVFNAATSSCMRVLAVLGPRG